MVRVVWNGPVDRPDNSKQDEKRDLPENEKPLRPVDLPADTELHPDVLFRDDRIPGEILFRDHRFPGKVFSYAHAFLDDREPYDLSSLLRDDDVETGVLEREEAVESSHATAIRERYASGDTTNVDGSKALLSGVCTEHGSSLKAVITPDQLVCTKDSIDPTLGSRDLATEISTNKPIDVLAHSASDKTSSRAGDKTGEDSDDNEVQSEPQDFQQGSNIISAPDAMTGGQERPQDMAGLSDHEVHRDQAHMDTTSEVTSAEVHSSNHEQPNVQEPEAITSGSEVTKSFEAPVIPDADTQTSEDLEHPDETGDRSAEDLIRQYYEAWGQRRREQDESFQRIRSDLASKTRPLEEMKLEDILQDLDDYVPSRGAQDGFWNIRCSPRALQDESEKATVPFESIVESLSVETQSHGSICTKAPCANGLVHRSEINLPDCETWFQGIVGLVVVFYFFFPNFLPDWIKGYFGPKVSPQAKRQWWWCRLILGVTMVWSTNWGFPEGLLESVCDVPKVVHWPQVWYCPESAWPIFRIQTDDWSCERRW